MNGQQIAQEDYDVYDKMIQLNLAPDLLGFLQTNVDYKQLVESISQIVNIVAIIVHCLEINDLQIELEACDFKLEEYRDVQQIASVFI